MCQSTYIKQFFLVSKKEKKEGAHHFDTPCKIALFPFLKFSTILAAINAKMPIMTTIFTLGSG